MNDNQIIKLFFTRDEDAIQQTAYKYGTRLTVLAANIVRNNEDAQECVNDTYLKAWGTIPPMKPDHFFAYLAKICRHFAFGRLDWNHAAKRNAEVIALTNEMEECIPSSWHDATVDSSKISELVSSFLRKQTPENRMIFVRRYWYGNSVSEIALRNELSQSAVAMRLSRTNGCLEYIYFISFEETDGRYMGKEIVFSFHSIDFQSHQRAGMPEPQVEGNWGLKWTLTGTDSNITAALNANIGDSDVILLDAEIGQISLCTRYQLKDYWVDWNEVALPQAVQGVRMKDGSEHMCSPYVSGFEDQEKMIYFIQSRMSYAILDLSQVESLMFHKGWELDANGKPTIQTFYYIPVSVS